MTDHWRGQLEAHYGIFATIERLDGEYDLNFRARRPTGDVILKVMRPGCDPALVAMQCQALDWMHAADPTLPLPKLIPAKDGAAFIAVQDAEARERLVWVQEALPGIALGKAGPQRPEILSQLGQLAGRLDVALEGFDAPALARPQKWALPDGGWIRDHLDVIEPGPRRALIADIIAQFDAIRPALAALPVQAIHNDLNDYNILIRPSLSRLAEITGLIDLGDMTLAPKICELAIAAPTPCLTMRRPKPPLPPSSPVTTPQPP